MKNLSKFFDYKSKEPEIAEKWQRDGIYRYEAGVEPSFKIDTPPPTVSGQLHMGHIFSYVQADIVARYKRMCGFNVFYPIGFDDNGLPTERLTQKIAGKQVGKNCTKEEFINECFKIIGPAEEEFEALFKQIGLSVDFSLKYQTISEKTSEISQSSFLDLYKKGLIYQKLAPVYFDTTDKTALAQADIEDKDLEGFKIEYKALIEIEKEKFKVASIMTTRPEMLPACVAVLFNPEDTRYSDFKGKHALLPTEIKNGKLEYKLEVPLIPDVDVSMIKGTGLVMCCAYGDMQDKIWIERHNLPLPTFEENGTVRNLISDSGRLMHPVFKTSSDEFMKVEDGRKFIIEKLLQSNLIVGASDITNIEDALNDSEAKVSMVIHSVKCGERSGKPVEILLKSQWYVSVLPFKRDLQEVIKRIDFHPSSMKIRLEQWIEGLNQDWCISRERFLGIAVPIRKFEVGDNILPHTLESIRKDFYVETFSAVIIKNGGLISENYFEMETENLIRLMETSEYLNFEDSFVLNGLDLELKHIGVKKYTVALNRNLNGLFKDLLEEINSHLAEDSKFAAKDSEVKRLEKIISEKQDLLEKIGVKSLKIKTEDLVLDTWFTSSVSPQIAWNNFLETPIFDLRPQAHEIIRTWAFYTIVKTYLHSLELKSPTKVPDAKCDFNSREFFRMKENPNIIPWKNVMLSGWCLASDKTKMSKSKGNVVTPSALIAEVSVDVVRLWCGSSSLGMDTAYSQTVFENGKKFTNKLWNVAKFVGINLEFADETAKITESFDKWIVAKLGKVFAEYKFCMESFEYSKAKDCLDEFFWKDLCDNYLEIIKVRYYGTSALIYKENPPQNPEEVRGKQASAIKALNTIFKTVLKLYAPFAPFITDEIYGMISKDSVHTMGTMLLIELPKFEIEEEAHEALNVINLIRKYKSENNLPMNASLEEFEYKTEFNLSELTEDLKNVTGVKEFKFID